MSKFKISDKFELRSCFYGCHYYRTIISLQFNSWLFSFKNEIKTILKANLYYVYGDNYSKIIEHPGIEKTPKGAVKILMNELLYFSLKIILN